MQSKRKVFELLTLWCEQGMYYLAVVSQPTFTNMAMFTDVDTGVCKPEKG